MKRLLLVLAVIVVLMVAGLAVFLATFDIDRYRPVLVKRLQESIGRPVALEHVSLGWRHGIALQVQGLALYEETLGQGEPLVQVKSASALISLAPLLRKEVRIASVLLRGARIHLVRDQQGRINLTGLAVAASPTAAAASSMKTGEAGVSFRVASLRIEDGELHWTDAARVPAAELWVKHLGIVVRDIAPAKPMDVEITGALISETPNIHLRGRITLPDPSHPGSLERGMLTIEHLPLDQVLPPAPPGEPQLNGKLTVTVQGSASTLDPAQVMRAISATGTLKLEEPRVANLNILRAVLERFSMLPGLVQGLQARLPPTHQEKLAATDTILSPIDVSLEMGAGALQFDALRLRTDTFELTGSGVLGLDGAVQIRSTLRIEPALSEALIKSVNELQGLTNSQGEIEIPLTIQGQGSRVALLPDMNYVASKLLSTKVKDLLGNFLQKALEKND